MLRKNKSLIIILFYEYLSSLSAPSYGGITLLLYSSLNDTYNNDFGTDCVSTLRSMNNFSQ